MKGLGTEKENLKKKYDPQTPDLSILKDTQHRRGVRPTLVGFLAKHWWPRLIIIKKEGKGC